MSSRASLQRAAVLALVLATARGSALRAQSDLLVNLHDLTPREHREAVFVLSTPQMLRIEAVGAEPRQDRRSGRFGGEWFGDDDERDVWPAAAWILDARTREVVWDLRNVQSERARSGVRSYTGTVRLPAGVYIAHYASYVATSTSYEGDFSLTQLIRGLRGRRDARYSGPYVDDGSYRDFRLAVRGEGRAGGEREAEEAASALAQAAIVQLRPDTGSATERFGFVLDRPTDVEVTAVGELRRDGAFDYGWILNADTRRRVWTMDYDNTEEAGGAHKNRSAHQTLHLAAGRYVAYFAADDSHDPDEWNSVPPFDPEAWGMTLRVADAGARARVRPFTYEPVPAGQTLVSLIGVRDDELRSEGFTLRQPMDVRIFAIGEGTNTDGDGEMDDYAWIVDATSHRRVWTMRRDATEHAGGADKNRLFDGVLHLEAGSYMVYYKSDGSHSYGAWNDAPPAESRYYGVSVFPASGHLDRSAVAPFERVRSNAIAELVRMRDDIEARRPFTLDQDQTVRVYAIGEGMNGDMYDYAWIEDAESRRVVWEMTYRMTTHAGGADKNRLFDGTLRLPAGRYILHYETDGSHAYGDWNADPPDDPEGWGVSILPARTP